MIIDEKSILSVYDDKCTLLQAINTLNENLKNFSHNIYNHTINLDIYLKSTNDLYVSICFSIVTNNETQIENFEQIRTLLANFNYIAVSGVGNRSTNDKSTNIYKIISTGDGFALRGVTETITNESSGGYIFKKEDFNIIINKYTSNYNLVISDYVKNVTQVV